MAYLEPRHPLPEATGTDHIVLLQATAPAQHGLVELGARSPTHHRLVVVGRMLVALMVVHATTSAHIGGSVAGGGGGNGGILVSHQLDAWMLAFAAVRWRPVSMLVVRQWMRMWVDVWMKVRMLLLLLLVLMLLLTGLVAIVVAVTVAGVVEKGRLGRRRYVGGGYIDLSAQGFAASLLAGPVELIKLAGAVG